MFEKEILKLLGVRKKHLNKKVSKEKFKIRYCRNFSSRKDELNYFVVNNNVATIQFKEKDATGYIEKHSIDKMGRPVGAKFFIKQGDGEYKRGNTVKPSFWNILNKNNKYDSFFCRGHIIASTFGGDKEMSDTSYRGELSQIIQTNWSNANDNGRNPYCQWRFEEKIKERVVSDSVCIASRPIYRNKADKIPIGIHLQAVTEKDSLFNVFLPNIDPNVKIDYKNCTFKLKKPL